MPLYQQEPPVKVADAWIVNDVGRAVCVKVDSPQYDYAIRGQNGWRPATAEEQAAGESKMIADGEKYRTMQEREMEARMLRRGRPMQVTQEQVVPVKTVLKGGK